MATGITVTGSRVEHRDLAYWMERVLKELEKVKTAPDPDSVHDLRVAIRRCRSVAAVMEEVDPDPAWPEMRKLPRKLFHALGTLRDVQVLEEWTKRLSTETDLARGGLLSHFVSKETELRQEALRCAAKFDEKAWKKSEQALCARARFAPPDGLAAECLALERLEAAKELHALCLRTIKPATWHALRIGVKRFRYTVEGLLPARYEAWSNDLKRMQDLLGEVHDLDVLSETILKLAAAEIEGSGQAWLERIAVERNNRLESYRQLTLGKTNIWHEWRKGLPEGARLEAAGLARLRVTARAMDGNSRRTGQISVLAMRLHGGLVKAHAAPVFADANLKKILRAAARVHRIGAGLHAKQPQKVARDFLLKMAVPSGWTDEEWRLMASIVRYHRGSQPQAKHKGFAKLREEERARVVAGAGVLRLARMLRKCGVESASGLRVDKSVDALIVQVPGFVDSEETAVAIAAGKHLLERCLGRPLLLKALPAISNVLVLPKRIGAAALASD
jgi:CHAD domain-containing protein